VQELKEKGNYEQRRKTVQAFNDSHPWRKRGLCLMPCTYHLTVSSRSAIVHVFRDGSVTIVSPGCEMGQGLQIKVLQTAAYELAKVSSPPNLSPQAAWCLPLHLV
jgi:xanthine dehydrogenase/oxidase